MAFSIKLKTAVRRSWGFPFVSGFSCDWTPKRSCSAGQNRPEKNAPQGEGNSLSPIEGNPRGVKPDGQTDQDGAQRHKQRNLLGTTGNAHHRVVQTILDAARTKKKPRGGLPRGSSL